MQRIDPSAQQVIAEGEQYSYDYLVIATGHRSDNEAVPGLGSARRAKSRLIGPTHGNWTAAMRTLSGFWDGYSDDPLILRNRMTAISLQASRCTWS